MTAGANNAVGHPQGEGPVTVLGGIREQVGVFHERYVFPTCYVECARLTRPPDRPPRTALGNWPFLLPIVVTCKIYADADVVNAINADIALIEGDDYHGLRDVFAHSPSVKGALTEYDTFYAIRVGLRTGVWVGYSW